MAVHHHHHHAFGLFPEGGRLDTLDKRLSFLIFSLDLGTVLEALLAGPFGTWFGAPLSAWTIYPLLIAWLAEHYLPPPPPPINAAAPPYEFGIHSMGITTTTSAEMFAVTMLGFALWSSAFYFWLWRGQVINTYLWTRKLMIPATTLAFVFAGRWAPIGVQAASFYMVAWILGQVIGYILKISAARRRPRVTIHAMELAKIRRSFPELQHMLSIGESAIESFPSGDTIGSACFATTLIVVLQYPPRYFFISLLTAFCRMYFHAHHLLDVVVGWVIGHFSTVALARWCETSLGVHPALAFDAWIAAGTVGLFILFHVVALRFKPALPTELVAKGRKGF